MKVKLEKNTSLSAVEKQTYSLKTANKQNVRKVSFG